MTTNTTIKAEIANLPSDILEYKGNYFLISKTKDGVRVEMSEKEKKLYVEKIKNILDEALLNSTIDINKLEAFDFNVDNRTFYAYNDKNAPFDGSYASQTVKINQAAIDIFLGKKPESSSTNSNPANSNEKTQRTGSPNYVKNQEPISEEPTSSDGQKRVILQDIRDPNSRILAPSLDVYDKLLEKRYNRNDNRIKISNPVIIQDNNSKSINGLNNLIKLFNREKSLHTIYAPVHIGSSPGRQQGHWIGLVLTRKLGAPVVAIYDSLGGRHINLANYIGQNIRASKILVSKKNVKHQDNAIDCGIFVLNFFKTMEEIGVNNLELFLDNPLKLDIPKLRKKIAKEIEENVTEDMFQADGSYDLETVKGYHLTLDENKFVGATELKKIHKAQLEEFRKDINAIRSPHVHFDWWTFPIKSTSDTRKSQYAIDNATIKKLAADEDFMKNYLESAQLVLAAYGWELKNKAGGYVIVPRRGSQRAIPEIRLAKMAESFHLFNHKLYEALVQLSVDHPSIIKVAHPRTVAAFKLDSWTSLNAWGKYLRSFY